MEIAIQFFEAIVPGIIVGIVLAVWNKQQKKHIDHQKEIEQEQYDKDMVKINLELASAQLAYAVAMAYKRGTPNGEMEVAIHQYEKAMANFRNFERKQMVKNIID